MAEQTVGLMDSVKRLLGTLSGIVSTRLELLSNELQEERLYWMRILLLGVVALFCLGVAALLLTALIVVLFWEDHLIAALAGLSGFFFALGALLVSVMRSKARDKSKLFSASLAELSKDRDQLRDE